MKCGLQNEPFFMKYSMKRGSYRKLYLGISGDFCPNPPSYPVRIYTHGEVGEADKGIIHL